MLLSTQGDRWAVLSMSAKPKEKLHTKILVLNPAKRLNISLQVERLQKECDRMTYAVIQSML